MKEAAEELERAVEAPARRPGERVAAPAPAPAPGAQIQAFVTRQTAGALTVAGQIGVALLLTYFLLGTGDAFRRKCARIAGTSLARRRVTVEVLNEIDAQVQAYMLILVVPNILIGVLTWLALAAVGVPNAGLWGAFVGGVHILPYVGTVIGAFAVGAASLVSNGNLAEAALAMGIVVAISTAIGMGLATWLQGRACRMNVVAVYVGLIFFGWLWGGWGLVLGFPLLAVLKSIADRVDAMLPIRELLAACRDCTRGCRRRLAMTGHRPASRRGRWRGGTWRDDLRHAPHRHHGDTCQRSPAQASPSSPARRSRICAPSDFKSIPDFRSLGNISSCSSFTWCLTYSPSTLKVAENFGSSALICFSCAIRSLAEACSTSPSRYGEVRSGLHTRQRRPLQPSLEH